MTDHEKEPIAPLSPIIVALDFDGVLNSYKSGFEKTTIPDPPTPGAIEFICALQDAGYLVAIHTAREGGRGLKSMIREWLGKYGLQPIRIEKILISSRKPIAGLYIDDRGFRFVGQFPPLDVVAMLIENPGESVDSA